MAEERSVGSDSPTMESSWPLVTLFTGGGLALVIGVVVGLAGSKDEKGSVTGSSSSVTDQAWAQTWMLALVISGAVLLGLGLHALTQRHRGC